MTDQLRIAYRGNFRHPFCTEVHVAASLEALGHQVVRLQENQTTWARCVEAAKGSDVFLWTKTWIIEPEQGHRALDELRRVGIPTASFHLDRYIGLNREAQIPKDPFWRTDFVFTADGGSDDKFREYGVNHHWMPPGMYDAEAHIGKPNPRRFPHPIVFVGSYPYPHAEWAEYRHELITRVRAEYASRFAIWPRPGQPIRGRDLSDLYASAKVVVGDSCLSRGATHYWSDRVPETLGRGGLLIHPNVEGMEGWYEPTNGKPGDYLGYELGDFDRVLTLIEWALTHDAEAEAVAKQGQATVLGRDTYKHRMATVIDTIRAAGRSARPVLQTVHARHRKSPRPTALQVRQGHPTDEQTISEVWRADQYQLEREHVRGKTVVDVGANIGAFSALAATMGAASVHAYEPEVQNAELLRLNTRGHAAVIVHEEALGADSGEATIVGGPEDAHGGGTHVGPADGHEESAVRVRQTGINEALHPLGPIGLLKLDCEGSEYGIVEAMQPAVLLQIERMVGEWHGPVMPHLAELWLTDDDFYADWHAFVTKLADYGRLTLHGHPRAGGTFQWTRY